MSKARVKWIEGRNFMGTDVDGRGTLITPGPGPGVGPMQMLLLALASCASVDLVEIMRKQRQPLDDLEIEIDGHRVDTIPRYFDKIHMRFILTGTQLDDSKVERAVRLSTEKYCSVHATLSGKADITWEYELRASNTSEESSKTTDSSNK